MWLWYGHVWTLWSQIEGIFSLWNCRFKVVKNLPPKFTYGKSKYICRSFPFPHHSSYPYPLVIQADAGAPIVSSDFRQALHQRFGLTRLIARWENQKRNNWWSKQFIDGILSFIIKTGDHQINFSGRKMWWSPSQFPRPRANRWRSLRASDLGGSTDWWLVVCSPSFGGCW